MVRASCFVGTVASLLIVLAPGCSSGNGSSGGQACPAGFDAGTSAGGTEAASVSGQCGNLLQGTKQNGEPCQSSADCAPTCCACPSGGHASQVALCNTATGTCVTGAGVCCVWLANSAFEDGGPYVCSH